MTDAKHRVIFHDDVNRAARDSTLGLDAAALAKAFVAALRPRRFEHWSSLASFALVSSLPQHEFTLVPGRRHCAVCGAYERLDAFDSDVFATMRRTGTVRSDSLRYAAYDLEQFSIEESREPEPRDRAFFDSAIARIANLRSDSKTFAAEKAVGVVFDSRGDRKMFLGVLGICGVMATPTRPGLWPTFVPYANRAYLDANPYTYPVTWWRRNFGLNRDALRAFGLDAYLSRETLAAAALPFEIDERR